jgi:hypothetical protein
MEQFGMPADQNGMMLSYVGMISLFMQGFGIAALSSKVVDLNIMKLSTVTLTLAYLALVRKSKNVKRLGCKIPLVQGPQISEETGSNLTRYATLFILWIF